MYIYSKQHYHELYYRMSVDTQLIEFVCIDKDAPHYVGASGK